MACALSGLFALAGCAADKPEPSRPIESELPMARGPEPEKGQGNLSFHYANQSTDANLAIDLNSTDVYLEMTGKAAQEQAERMQAPLPDRKPEPPARKTPAPARESKAPEEPSEAPESGSGGEESPAAPQAGKGKNPDLPQPGKGLHKAPPRKPEPEAETEEDPAGYEDVTAKVLTGIRKAQELFYQKRYPEAMQAVRSSQDARPTAEGYALQGSIHFMQGQIGMARRQWMEALRLNPDMPSVVNMLERTRTPGGRGSPSPRPVYRPPAPAPSPAVDPEAPYPEEGSVPAPAVAVPASSAGAPASAAPPAGPPANPSAASPAPAAAIPAAAASGELEGAESATAAPTAPAPATPPPASPAAPAAPAPGKPAPRKPAPAQPAAAPAKEGHK